MEYLSAKEAAEKWGVSERRVHQYCENGRIPGAQRFGKVWAIPAKADKPGDPRKARKTRKMESDASFAMSNQVDSDSALASSHLRTGAVIMAAGAVDSAHALSPMTQLGDLSVIKRIIQMFQRVQVFPIVVVTGHQALDLEQHLINYGVVFVRNENYRITDKFVSAKLGFEFLKNKCDRVFFASVMTPMFTSETLHCMMTRKERVVIPTFLEKRGHPVLVSRDTMEKIMTYDGENGMYGAIQKLETDCFYLEVPDEGILSSKDSMGQIDHLLSIHNDQLLHPFLKINIEREHVIFDRRTKLLLMLIQETNSVQTACRQIAMSRGKAWDVINQMEAALGFPVVERRQGGSRGGKTKLTEKGQRFLETFQEYEMMVRKYAAEQFQLLFQDFQ